MSNVTLVTTPHPMTKKFPPPPSILYFIWAVENLSTEWVQGSQVIFATTLYFILAALNGIIVINYC